MPARTQRFQSILAIILAASAKYRDKATWLQRELLAEDIEKLLIEALADAEATTEILAKKLSKVRDQRAELVRQVAALSEENRSLTMTVEEGADIERDLSIALAILAGETLKPCVGGCPGHLREKAAAAVNGALAAWHALQEGNQKLMAEYAPVVLERDRLRQEVAFLRPGTAHPDAQDARLGRTLREILEPHRAKPDDYEESAPATLRRIIRELQAFRAREKTEPLVLLRDLLIAIDEHHADGEAPMDTLRRVIRERAEYKARASNNWQVYLDVKRHAEAVERENRAKCVELAEMAGDIRELKELLDDSTVTAERKIGELQEHVERLHAAEKLLVLLNSEDASAELVDVLLARPSGVGPATAAWRWFREQVGIRQEKTAEP